MHKAGLALLLAVAASTAQAQPYPARPVRVIVAYAPGGGSDLLARLVAPRLTQEFGQQFIVDNRPGGNTLIAMQLLANAPADGYTLGVIDTAFVINPPLMDKLPYDSARAFAPVTLLATSPFVLVVHPAVAAKTVTELVALAKAKPGQITFSSAGPGTGTRIASDQFRKAAGIEILQVPYKGGAPSAAALIGGEVNASFATLPLMYTQIRAGRARALAVTGARRYAQLPEAPTLAEAGYRDVTASGFWGVVAPAGVPPVVVTRLNEAIARYLQTPEVRETLAQMHFEGPPPGMSVVAFGGFLKTELARWEKAVKETGAKLE
ncbi:MAG: tripartite tricarboxylate transporter substrate binding protein [Burkholderiales bacterium]